jgi:hypothetical protein
LDEVNGELVAIDYGRYLADKDVIDAVVRLMPDSYFAAGWVITLAKAAAQLNKESTTDYNGGLAGFTEGLARTATAHRSKTYLSP